MWLIVIFISKIVILINCIHANETEFRYNEENSNRLLNQLYELNRKIELISIENANRKAQDIKDIIASNAKDYQIQLTIESLNHIITNLETNQNLLMIEMKTLKIDQLKIFEKLQNDIYLLTDQVSKNHREFLLEIDEMKIKKQNGQEDIQVFKTQNLINQAINDDAKGYTNSLNCDFNILDGVYSVHVPHSCMMPFKTFCMLDSNGGRGWTIVLRRRNGTENFARDWYWYKHGFGNPNDEFFLGLEKIYQLTTRQPHEIWFKLENDKGQIQHVYYNYFEIGNEDKGYYLKNVGKYSGTAGDFLGKGNVLRKFTTIDVDNDKNLKHNCATKYQSAWWYDHCNWKTLTGNYSSVANEDPINWIKLFKYAHMAIRPIY